MASSLVAPASSVVLEMPAAEVQCWGCRLHIALPHFTSAFKCGWCGAVTFANLPTPGSSRWTRCANFRDRIFVGVVFGLIGCITAGGVWAVYPVLFPNHGLAAVLNIAITVFLAFNTLSNYCLSAFLPAGPLPEVPWGSADVLAKGALEGHTFCLACSKPKPAQAHHCRTCRTCVVDMDHHCPFIGNCVGANNHRHFMLFLVYTFISGSYVVVMTTLAGLRIWPVVLDVYGDPATVPRSPIQSLSTVLTASFMDAFEDEEMGIQPASRSLVIIYLIVTGLAIVAGMALLLRQQLELLYEGQTYVDSLRQDEDRAALHGWSNLRRVFGSRHPVLWLLPSFGSVKSRDKLHAR